MSGYMIWFETEFKNRNFGPRLHWPLYIGGGGWDSYGVGQPNCFAWFGNGHFWTGDLRNDVKNENSINVLGHQFKSGNFQCKTQIRQNNWVGTPRKGHKPQPHIQR